MSTDPIVLSFTYDFPSVKIWKALTDVEDMRKWYFPLADFKPEVGFEFKFTAGDENVQFRHECQVTEVVVGKKIAYTWRYPDYPGNSEVSFEIFEEGEKNRVVITHAGIETFPQDDPSFARESFNGGWTYFLENLGKFLKEE